MAEQWSVRHLSFDVVREGVDEEGFLEPRAGYRDAYLKPILRLLAECLAGGPAEWSAVYADERLRFIDQTESQRALVAEMLAADESDLVDLCRDDLDLAGAMATEVRRLHAPLVEKAGREVGLLMVGDCVMTEIRALATVLARRRGIDVRGRHVYFSARQGVGLDTDAVTRAIRDGTGDIIALSFLTFEGIPAYRALLAHADGLGRRGLEREVDVIVAVIADFIRQIREMTPATIAIHGACGLPLGRWRKRLPLLPAVSRGRRRVIDRLNNALRELAGATDNAIFIDEESIIADMGLRGAGAPLLPARVTRGAMFHTTRFGPSLAPTYDELVAAHGKLATAKVLLVDFDNTLWHGVMAEGEVEHERGRQRILRELKEAGVLLVALSKNSSDSIRWDELELTEDDFVLQKVSWDQKAQSILEAIQQLDLGADAFVLIDDNPAERELVRQRLPAVSSLDPTDPATWRALEWMLEFPNTGRSAEAAKRTDLYREAAARREVLAADLDISEMMRSLELEATFAPAREHELGRVHELLARTNQFNTTTNRRSERELRELIESDRHAVYAATLADKFGALGLVGVVVVERSAERLEFDSVVMSCRAMGFGLEYLMIAATLEAESGWKRAVGRYVPTARNSPCADLFESAGFSAVNGSEEWILEGSQPRPTAPDWLAIKQR